MIGRAVALLGILTVLIAIHTEAASPLGTMRFGKRAMYQQAMDDVVDDEGLMERVARSHALGTMRFGKRSGDVRDENPYLMYAAKRNPLGTMRFGRR